jgi:hypothetical protein
MRTGLALRGGPAAGPRAAVIGWVRGDGEAATAPVWFRFADGLISLSVLGDSWRWRTFGEI